MKKYQKILKEVLEQENYDRERKIDYLMPSLCGLVDDAPYISALSNGVAALTALYILCTTHDINTINYYQEIQERLEYLTNDLLGDMLEKFPPRLPTEED